MKSAITKCAATALMLGAFVVPTFAAPPHNIDARERHQQHRIHEGMHNGSLTHREARHLERREHNLRHTEMHERHHNGGNLTNRERWRLSHRENHMSHSIWHQKHDAQHH